MPKTIIILEPGANGIVKLNSVQIVSRDGEAADDVMVVADKLKKWADKLNAKEKKEN